VRLPYAGVQTLFAEWGREDLLAPLIGVMDFEQAMRLPLQFPSHINPAAGAEGFVVCGYRKVFRTRSGSPFLCKRKNPQFLDIEGGDGANPAYYPVTRYINTNRVASVESKHGEFNNLKAMAEYIDLVIAEVDADFNKDHGEPPSPSAAKFKNYIATMIAKYVKAK